MEAAERATKAKAARAGARAKRGGRKAAEPDGDCYAAIEALLLSAIVPGGRVYEEARAALVEGAEGAKPDTKPIKEALSLLQMIRELRADTAQGREIRVEFSDPRGLIWSE